MDARILDGCDCDADFEFTDVIFTIFWMPLAWRPRILFRCFLVGTVFGEILGLFR